ncbi:MAG: hypothetical protein A3F68_11110 [Acidobacteria bacterium RIFCSPLOWO2_12_FULL_54_10]|nr:MAG: hypothetical protein A3F68_11110 [Acidobacteria bacterium RIFCSPLOWO2_12_FULL_54_10]
MRRLLLSTLSVLMLASFAGAQTPEQSWDNLKTLREGEKIQVVDQKLKSQNGTFVSVSDEDITIQSDQDAVTIQRGDVFRVSSKERGRSRGQNALRGLMVGAGVGVGLGGAMYASGGLDVSQGEALAAAFVAVPLWIGGIGAGIGAAMPAGHPTIYRAERRKDQTAP